jgi:chitodextrinase
VLALLACVAPAVGVASTTPLTTPLWGIAPSGAATPGTADLKTLRSEGVNALVLDVQRLGRSKTTLKRIDAMRVLANSLKMSLVTLVPPRGGASPAVGHALKLCRTTSVRCATIAPSVPAAIRMAAATDKTRTLVAVYVSKPSMLAQLTSVNSLRRRILVIAPLYKTFNDQLWGSVITSAAASRAVDLAIAPVSPLGSPSVQRFGATLSAQSTTAGTAPDVTAPSAPSVSVVGVTASSASVWWLPSVDDVGVTAYRLYVGGALFDGHGTSPEMVGNLPCGVPVTIAVDAVDAAGNASAKSTVTATPGPCGGGSPPVAPAPSGDTTPPSTPTGVSVSGVGETAVTLSWSASTDDVGVAGYRLYRDGSAVGTSTTTRFDYSGLTCASTYALGVAAVDAAGNVSGTATANVATAACPPPPPPPDTTPPSTPSGLSLSGASPSTITLSWSPSTDDVTVTGYQLFRDGAQVDTVTGTNFTFTGLACATTYSLGVDAFDAAANVSGTSLMTVATLACAGDSTPPSTPAGLATSAVGQTSVTLSWSPSTDDTAVTEYRVFRGGSQIGTSATTDYTYTGLTCATTYTLGVAAADAAGNVSSTGTKSVTTTACPDTTPPSTPTGLATSTVGQTSIALSWNASTDNVGVTGYRVFRDGSQVGTPTATGFSFTALTCGTTYTLGVAAVDAAGNVSGIATANVATAACPDTTPPSSPTNLATSAVAATSATLSWTAATDDLAVTGYRLYQGGSQVGTSATTSYGYTGLTCETTYTLGVAAVDAAGNLSGTATKSVTTAACPDTIPPSTPTGLATSAVGTTSATLSWTASTDNVAVSSYRLFQNGSQVGTSTTASFGYTGLTCGTTYTLGVIAVDAAGNVSGTASKSVTTATCADTTPPATPTALVTSAVAATSATLSWTASTDNVAVTGYRLFQGSSQVGTSATTSFGYTGLTCATTYTLGVAAVDAAGNVSGTATKSITTAGCPDTTAPSTTTGLATSAIGQTSVALSWNASTDNFGVIGYRVFQNGSQVGTPSATGFSFTALTCGTTYTLGVAAVDAAGNVSGTATKSATTAACPDTTAPSTPTGLATSAVSTTSATLSWTASTDNVAVTGYRLYQGGSQVGTSATASYNYTGLTCATTFTLGVAAVDAAGNVSGNATKSVTTAVCPDTTPPSTPAGLSVGSAGQTSLSLSWNASTDNVGVTGYRIFQNGSQVSTSISPGYIFGGLSCGTTYTLGVAAVDGAGNVSGTTTVSGSTTACSGGGTTANVFVSTSGSDSTCVRGDSSKPCLSFSKACSIAQAGDVVQVNNGTYPAQTIAGCVKSSPGVTFEAQTQHGVLVSGSNDQGGLTIGSRSSNSAWLTFDGIDAYELGVIGPCQTQCSSTGGDYPVGDTHRTNHITVDHMKVTAHGDTGADAPVYIDQTDYLTWENSEVGPVCCNADGADIYPTLSNIVVDNVDIHDIGESCSTIPSAVWANCSSQSTAYNGNHIDCLQFVGGDTITIANSQLINCAAGTLMNGVNRQKYRNYTLQNNFFQGHVLDMSGGGGAGGSFGYAYTGFVHLFFNTVPDGTNFQDWQPGGDYEMVGNIFGDIPPDHGNCDIEGTNGDQHATFSLVKYNIFDGSQPGTAAACGATNTNANPTFLNAGNRSAGINLHLSAGSAGINAIPTSFCSGNAACPTKDIDGQARPLGTADDTGADEAG